MENSEIIKNVQNRFSAHFSLGSILSIESHALPPEVFLLFDARAQRFTEPSGANELECAFMLHYTGGGISYVACHKKFHQHSNRDTEDLTYIADVDLDSRIMGVGEMCLNRTSQSEYFSDKPFVGWTMTFPDYIKRGLGKRRLCVLNAMAQSLYQKPLYSDVSLTSNAESLWTSLVDEKKAHCFVENKFMRRYAFL